MRSETSKLKSLRALCQAIVKGTKKGVATPAEDKHLREVAKDLLGRDVLPADLRDLQYS